MKSISILRNVFTLACLALAVPAITAQNSYQLFGPVNVRTSQAGAGYGADAVNFNSTTLNLTCSASPITATLSSTADNTGYVLTDNSISVTVSASGITTAGPTNVCVGGVNSNGQNCFTSNYQNAANAGSLTGQNPDTFSSTGGVAPLNIANMLQSGQVQVVINEVDNGGYLAASSLYLNTNCSKTGVTGPAEITGNPISQSNPTQQQLTQNFPFNVTTNQQVEFIYDLSEAEAAQQAGTGTLTITDGTIPGTSDMPIDPTMFQSTYVPNTSFATSSCLIHTGELLANGSPACKMYTLECTVGTGNNESGAQCPVSSLPNEIFQAIFDGPSFTLSDIPTPNGPTFHTGIGFLMAAENWTGGPCTFDPASGLEDVTCPQNLLASFSGPGVYDLTGKTSHPNSAFVPVIQVPEDLTTVTVTGEQPGNWVNTSAPSLTLSSQPPNLTGTSLPGASSFVPSPIQSITYGISAPNAVPQPANPASTDTVVTNNAGCPTPSNPLDPPAAVFATPLQTLNSLPDGNYVLHYYAQDCAGTEELQFTQGAGASWSTSYYTVPINIDTVLPVVSSGPILSPLPGLSGSYTVGESVTATYSCTDDRSGVVRCGASTFSPGSTLNTGLLSSPVDTSTPGAKIYTVQAIDAAGNQSSASVNYNVIAYDAGIQLKVSNPVVTYPQGTNVVISVSPANGRVATGQVQLYDGATLLQTSNLGGNGAAYLYIQDLSVGVHSLSAKYSGDANHPAGVSAPVSFKVNPVPVRLSTSCWNASFPYGENYTCGVYLSSAAGAPQGVITYQYDGGSPVTLPVQNGTVQFVLNRPPAGNHTVTIGYAAQTNYAAAATATDKFTVTPAPVVVQLVPSTYYLTGGNLTLTATIASWSAGPPNQIGTVTFSNGKTVLSTVPVTAGGTASVTLAASSLSNGSQTFTASYSGGADYAAGKATATVTVK